MDSSLEKLEDLLVKRSLEGLDETESGQLNALLAMHPEIDVDAFDRAAAAVSVARLAVVEEMPANLYQNIEAIGTAMVAQRNAGGSVRTRRRYADARRLNERQRANPIRPPRPALTPWLIAAASLMAAAVAWWPGDAPEQRGAFADRRAALIAAGSRTVPWTAGEDATAAAASGDVVWDDGSQEGYMRIVMLSTNDPGAFQYQLWIFDAERDDRYPVDGGVFDVPADSGEVIVPIRAKLPVHRAALFAITVERPGGVVVSGRERIALIADFG